jgi:hypothetical protein
MARTLIIAYLNQCSIALQKLDQRTHSQSNKAHNLQSNGIGLYPTIYKPVFYCFVGHQANRPSKASARLSCDVEINLKLFGSNVAVEVSYRNNLKAPFGRIGCDV